MNVALVLMGLVGLYFGGEWLVRYAVALARLLRIAPMVIGLTVVAFGTSAPELAASVVAALQGVPEIAVANVVGSNVANIGLILGATALVYPLVTSRALLRRELPWMLAVTALAVVLLADGNVTRLEGGVLVVALGVFLWLAFRQGGVPAGEVEAAPAAGVSKAVLGSLAGVLVLAVSAQALIVGATALATEWGVPPRVIGLTLVAVGTSLPELASSLVAALRRQTDIILGNVIGSNIFNLLAVLGTASLVQPMQLDAAPLRLDLLVMALFAVLLLPLIARGERIGRSRGTFLLLLYAAYTVVIFM